MTETKEALPIPHIDSRVAYKGVSELRKLNADTLRGIEGLIVLQDNGHPIAVILPSDLYLQIQEARRNGERSTR